MSEAHKFYGRGLLGLAAVAMLCATFAGVGQAQTDSYKGYVGSSAQAPSTNWVAVDPDDATNFTYYPRAIYVGGAGDVAAVDWDGNVVVFEDVPAGTLLPIRPKRINETNTTATLMVAVR